MEQPFKNLAEILICSGNGREEKKGSGYVSMSRYYLVRRIIHSMSGHVKNNILASTAYYKACH